jgi:hypothetical protein
VAVYPTYRHRAAPLGIIDHYPTTETGRTGHPVSNTLDQTQGRGRRSQCRGQQRRQQRSGDLMTQVGKEAGTTDPPHPRGQPPLLLPLLHQARQ